MRFRIAVLAACVVRTTPMFAQTTSLSRSEAIQTALERGARLAVARADTVCGRRADHGCASLSRILRSRASYSKSVPTYHYRCRHPVRISVALRQLRDSFGGARTEGREPARAIRLAPPSPSTPTPRTLAPSPRAIASRCRGATSLDADSVLHMVERRRDAGDASEMDVELARVSAGQQANLAVGDSLTLISTLLDLQAVLGMSTRVSGFR